MNRHFMKLKKACATFLSMLMVTSTVLAALPNPVYAAAITPVREDMTTGQDKDYSYTFRFGSETTVKTKGVDNKLYSFISGNKGAKPKHVVQEIKSDSQKGNISVTYENVGPYKLGDVDTTMDLTITITDWGKILTPRTITQDGTSTGEKTKPMVLFRTDSIGVNILDLEWVACRFQFFDHATGEAVKIKGHATLSDLDSTQAFAFIDNGNIDKVSILKGNNHLSVQGNKIVSSKDLTTESMPEGWSTVYFNGVHTLRFYQDEVADGEKYIARGADGSLLGSHFGFISKAIGFFPMDPPEKTIAKASQGWGTAIKAASTIEKNKYLRVSGKNNQSFDIPGTSGTSKFKYIIHQQVRPNRYSSFTVTDKVDDCLKIIKNEAKVTRNDSANVTDRFDITVSGQTITFKAKKEYLDNDTFVNNQDYYFYIPVQRDKGKNAAEFTEGMYYLSNKAKRTIDYTDLQDGKREEETDNVWARYKPGAVGEQEIEKRVGDRGAAFDDANTADSADDAYRIHEYAPFDYLVNSTLDSTDPIESFRIQDTFEECLDIDNESKVSITDKDGKLVTSKFDVSISEDKNGKKTVTCAATDAALADPEFYTGQTYTVRYTVHRKKTTDIKTSMKEWLSEDGFSFYIPNTASVYVKGSGDKEVQSETNESWVYDTVKSELQVEKTCIPYDAWEVGSEVEYAVRVTQTRQDGYAVNVEAWDYDLPEGLKLVPSSIKVTDSNLSDGSIANVVPEGTNGWKATCPRMQYGDYFVVSFKAKADETVNGVDTINTAYATAENFTDADDNKQTVSDTAEAWVNTPNLTIDKYVDKYEHEVGDQVTYTIVVNNTKDYTVAKDVVVSDLTLPQGLELAEGEDNVHVDFSPASAQNTVGWPVADGTSVIQKEDIPNEVQIMNSKNVWIVNSKYLSSDTSMTITFDCVATEALNGIESQNQASVVAANSAKDADGNPIPSWDDAKVYVNTVDLTIDKTASQYEWEVGDEVQYNITVSNTDSAPGTIARNVVIKDIEIPEGLELTDLNNVLVNGVPVTIVDKIAGPADVPNQLDPEYYNSTQEKENSYLLTAEGNGFSVAVPNLPQGEVISIDFPCTALTVAEGEDGWEWINKASVTADNQRGHETVEDDAEIYINTANLTIDKQFTNPYYQPDAEDYDNREPYEFRVGEDVEYTLTINNVQKNSIARNVVIEDVTLPTGFMLNGENPVTVSGYMDTLRNPIPGTPDTANQLDENHYHETEELAFNCEIIPVTNEDGSSGFNILIENLPCTTGDTLNPEWTTPLTVTYHCVATEEANGDKIINTAKVRADNAGEKKDSEIIWINSPRFELSKEADRKEYSVGDIITYTVTAEQARIGCVARNVFFIDQLLTEGVKLQKNSIVVMDETGKVINSNDYDLEVYNDHFSITNLGMDLICPDGNYPLADLDKNGAIVEGEAYNPLGITKQKKITIEYQAVAVEESLAGHTVLNKVTVNSDENIPVDKEEEVPIESPVLNIEKTSDKEVYKVGETGIYKLVITNLVDEVPAINVKVKDALQTEGAKIVAGSIQAELNNQAFEPVSLEATETGFTMVTGKDLTAADKLEIVYRVLFESPELDGKKVKNIAVASGDNTPEESQENVVEVGDLPPTLAIEKTSDKKTYEIGEIGHYTVVVTQTRDGATARKVIIKDALQEQGAAILPDTIKIVNHQGVVLDKAEIEAAKDGYTIYTGQDLAYGESFTVTYDVSFAEETLAGKDILNIARATADNAHAETNNDVNTPVRVGDGLEALKTCSPANGSVVKNGDTITYHIAVTNTSKQEKATVLVKDKIPQYTEFVGFPDEPEGVAGEAKTLDNTTYATFVLTKLAAGETREVSFIVKVVDAPKEAMIVNVGQVRETIVHPDDITDGTWNSNDFKNTNETVHFLDTVWTTDSNEVEVPEKPETPTPEPEGEPEIEKTVSNNTVNVGDTVKYTLNITTTADAKAVVIKDTLDHDKAVVVKDSIKTYLNDKAFQPEKITASGSGFTIITGKDLKAGEKMKVTYDVQLTDPSLAGQTVKNTAVLKTDNFDPKEDDTTVNVNKEEESAPKLSITKTASASKVSVGSSVKYTLTVKQTVEGAVAKNVVIRDTFNTSGMKISDISAAINGVKLTGSATVTSTGFTIQTGKDLKYGDTMTITYTAKVNSDSLKGKTIRNTAVASSDNTTPVDANADITVNGTPASQTPSGGTSGPGAAGSNLKGGSTTTTAQPVKTGDDTPILMWVVLAAAALGALGAGYIILKKRNKQDNQ